MYIYLHFKRPNSRRKSPVLAISGELRHPRLFLGALLLNQRFASDLPALKFGAAHFCAYSLDDQVPFKFGDGPDDDNNSAAQRAAGVDLSTEADELHYTPLVLTPL
jgi:hypothetical protein